MNMANTLFLSQIPLKFIIIPGAHKNKDIKNQKKIQLNVRFPHREAISKFNTSRNHGFIDSFKHRAKLK